MPDFPRLQELRRQQALLQEHLAWLERELAAAEGAPAPPLRPKPFARAAVIGSAPPQVGSTGTPDPDELLAQFNTEEKSGPPSKQGCWLIFWLMLLVGGFAVGAVIYFAYH